MENPESTRWKSALTRTERLLAQLRDIYSKTKKDSLEKSKVFVDFEDLKTNLKDIQEEIIRLEQITKLNEIHEIWTEEEAFIIANDIREKLVVDEPKYQYSIRRDKDGNVTISVFDNVGFIFKFSSNIIDVFIGLNRKIVVYVSKRMLTEQFTRRVLEYIKEFTGEEATIQNI